MLFIGNSITWRLAAFAVFLLITACDMSTKPKESDVPSWEGDAPGVGQTVAPEFSVGVPVEVEVAGGDGSLAERGFKVRLENQRIVRTGDWTRFYPDGSVRAEGTFENDKRHGAWVNYFESGRKETEGSYHQNERSGRWTTYQDAEDQPIEMVESFDNGGRLNHRAVFYLEPNNVPKVESEMFDGHPMGVVVRYDTNGDCWIIEDRERNGDLTRWEMYLPDGSVFALFANGEYHLQGLTRRRLSLRDAFRDAKARLASFGGKTRVLE